MLQLSSEGAAAPLPIFGHRSVCFTCGVSTLRTRTQLVDPYCPERNVIIGMTFPHLVLHLSRVCRTCWFAARRSIQREMQQDADRPLDNLDVERESPCIPLPPPLPNILLPQPIEQATARIVSLTHRRAASTSRHCIFSGCENIECLLVPIGVKQMLLSRYRYYVPPAACLCRFHLENDSWDQLDSNNRDFTAIQVDEMLKIMERATLKTLDYEIDDDNVK